MNSKNSIIEGFAKPTNFGPAAAFAARTIVSTRQSAKAAPKLGQVFRREVFQIPLLLIVVLFFMASCAGIKPYKTERVVTGVDSRANSLLKNIPDPENKIVVAVYDFRDQTGQYKPSEGISYSTAVTQGATSILIASLEDSGWFTPIERAGISNLLNERRIIQATRQANNDATQLTPLLFAGVLLEGGIIGYDSNIMTGGAGARYLGIGASGQFRKDQVTIYLRAVSTRTGRVLESVHTTKSILSRKISASVFRYVALNELLEAEAGVTFNEPATLAVTEAIDAAVRRLIVKGVEENLWNPADLSAFADYKQQLLEETISRDEENTDYYGLTRRPDLRQGFTFATNFSYGSYIGSYGNESINPGFMAQFEVWLFDPVSLKINFQRTTIGSEGVFSNPVNSADLLLNAYLTPGFRLSPYISIGGGFIMYDEQPDFTTKQIFPAVTAAAGLDYRFSETFGLRAGINYRYLFSDELDGAVAGTIHDQQWTIITGLILNFN